MERAAGRENRIRQHDVPRPEGCVEPPCDADAEQPGRAFDDEAPGAVIGGLGGSLFLDTPSGPSVVVCAAALFALSAALGTLRPGASRG